MQNSRNVDTKGMKLTLFFVVGSTWLLNTVQTVLANSIKWNKSWVPRKKTLTGQNKKKQNKQGEFGRFTRCCFRAEILQIYKVWTQMILTASDRVC